MLSTLLNKYNR